MKKYFLLLVLLLTPFVSINAEEIVTHDLSNRISIFDVQLFTNSGDIASSTYSIDSPDAVPNGIGYNDKFGFSFNFSLNNFELHQWDSAFFEIEHPSLALVESSEGHIYDSNLGSVGWWNVEKGGTKTYIRFVFSNEVVEGQYYLSGHIESGTSNSGALLTSKDFINTFSIGGYKIFYKYLGNDEIALPLNRMTETFVSASNDRINWGINYGADIERYITDSSYASSLLDQTFLKENVYRENLLFEDKFENATDLEFSIRPLLNAPISDTESTASNISTVSGRDLKTLMTEITQKENETYEEFKARVQSSELQYGLYKDSTGIQLVIYFGDFPNSKLQYKDSNWNIFNDIAIGTTWSDDQKNLYGQTHNDNNAIGGAISFFSIRATSYYDTVITDVDVENTVIETTSAGVVTSSAIGTLSAYTGYIIPVARQVVLYKFDEDTKNFISDSKFKLQIKNSDNTFVDYSDELTTDDEGKITISNLKNGEYRFVEIEPASGYSIDSQKYYFNDLDTQITSETHFTISSADDTGYIIYVSNKKETTSETSNGTSTNNTGVKGETTSIVNPKTGVISLLPLIIPLILAIYIFRRITLKKI